MERLSKTLMTGHTFSAFSTGSPSLRAILEPSSIKLKLLRGQSRL